MFFSTYPEFITKNYVENLTGFLDYAKSILQLQNSLLLTDFIDSKFFDQYPEAKTKVIAKLFEAMFVSITFYENEVILKHCA